VSGQCLCSWCVEARLKARDAETADLRGLAAYDQARTWDAYWDAQFARDAERREAALEGVMVRREKESREPGVSRQRPHLHNGQGVNHAGTREPGVEDAEHEYHPMTMPEVRRWFHALSARLRHVRILRR
jgi:hypothetical protein